MVNNGNVIVGICLDESGSMTGIREQTITGLNAYLDGLKTAEGETRVSLTLFSDRGDGKSPMFRAFCAASEVKLLPTFTEASYTPSGNTPLLDAIGHTITRMSGWLAQQKEPWTVLFVIQTDGEENSSREYNNQQIADLIRAREADGWKFIYLGAGLSDFKSKSFATAMGMSVGSTMSYDKADTVAAYSALRGTTSSVRADSSMTSDQVADETRRRLDETKTP